MKLINKKISRSLLFGLLFLASAATIRADDDDEDEDENHEHHSAKGLANSEIKLKQKKNGTDLGIPIYPVIYKEECTSCHMAYHPALLPTTSWYKMMANLKDHFGVDATLEPKQREEILKFLVGNSAEKNGSKRALKLVNSIKGAKSVPLSYSETDYFKQKHHEISAPVFKRKGIGSAANCLSCHPRAEKGGFSEHEVKIPKG